MAFYAANKPIRGEKTPAHIYHLPTLLDWFPNAKFVHMFRDPRAIFMSEKTKKAKAEFVNSRIRLLRQSNLIYEIYMSLSVITHWLRVAQLHHQYQQLYPDNYYLLKFEDLITDPQTHLRELCDFLEIDFTKSMLHRKVVNSSFVSPGEIAGFDQSVADRWRQQLYPTADKLFTSLCNKYLVEFGYQSC